MAPCPRIRRRSVPFAGTNSGYVSNNGGGAYAYTNTTSNTSHFYRDVTVPAGETAITLSFQLKVTGESGFDRLLVYTAPTSVTPDALRFEARATLSRAALDVRFEQLTAGFPVSDRVALHLAILARR